MSCLKVLKVNQDIQHRVNEDKSSNPICFRNLISVMTNGTMDRTLIWRPIEGKENIHQFIITQSLIILLA